MRFTVTWTVEARAQLAELWLQGTDRESITQAAHEIDSLLRVSGAAHATLLHEGLWTLQIAPLSVAFSWSESDRMIEVGFVRKT